MEDASGWIYGKISLYLLGKRGAAFVCWRAEPARAGPATQGWKQAGLWRDLGKMVFEEEERWNAAVICGKAKKKSDQLFQKKVIWNFSLLLFT